MAIVSLYVSNNQLKFKQRQQESNQEIYNLMLSQQGKLEEGKQLEQNVFPKNYMMVFWAKCWEYA